MTPAPDQQLVISQPLAQKVVDYLKTRPYEEVFQLIHPLLHLQPVSEKKEDDGRHVRDNSE